MTGGGPQDGASMGGGDGWLREAMQLLLADLGNTDARALVMTVIAWQPADGRLVQLTVSGRAPRRLYLKILDPEEIRPDGHPRLRRHAR
jgi:hypothetical protein